MYYAVTITYMARLWKLFNIVAIKSVDILYGCRLSDTLLLWILFFAFNLWNGTNLLARTCKNNIYPYKPTKFLFSYPLRFIWWVGWYKNFDNFFPFAVLLCFPPVVFIAHRIHTKFWLNWSVTIQCTKLSAMQQQS